MYVIKNLLRTKQVNPANTAQMIVLIGVKEQCALYPSKQTLLTPSVGINVDKVPKVKTIVNTNNHQ